jgi:hypothetical protein
MNELDTASVARKLTSKGDIGRLAGRIRLGLLVALSLAVAVTGCTGDAGRPAAAPSDTSEAPPGVGSDDVSVSSEGASAAAPVAITPVGCEMEIALECSDGFVDGCLLKHPSEQSKPLTSHHVCVARAEAKGGPPCAQDIARECPQGQRDACLVTPRLSDLHICVTIQ